MVARINIDDDIESRDEFWALLELTGGNRDIALGKLVRFFRIAQKYYGQREAIPKEELEKKGLAEMISSGWAIPKDSGYESMGAAKQFGWYEQRVEAGRRSGESRRASVERNAPPVERNTISVERNTISVERNPTVVEPLALSLAPSLALKEEEEERANALPSLASIPGSEILVGITPRAQESWVNAFGLELIKREIPKAAAKWASDELRAERGALPLYLYNWFRNADHPPASKAAPPRSPTDFMISAEETKRYIAELDATPLADIATVRKMVRSVVGEGGT